MFKRQIDKPFGEVLVERTVIDRKQLNLALDIQRDKGGLLGEILVSLDFVTEEEIAHTLSLIYGFPYLPLQNYDISSELIAMVPRRVAEHYALVPIDKIGNSITVAMTDPLNKDAIDDIKYLTKSEVQIFISTRHDVFETINSAYETKQLMRE